MDASSCYGWGAAGAGEAGATGPARDSSICYEGGRQVWRWDAGRTAVAFGRGQGGISAMVLEAGGDAGRTTRRGGGQGNPGLCSVAAVFVSRGTEGARCGVGSSAARGRRRIRIGAPVAISGDEARNWSVSSTTGAGCEGRRKQRDVHAVCRRACDDVVEHVSSGKKPDGSKSGRPKY